MMPCHAYADAAALPLPCRFSITPRRHADADGAIDFDAIMIIISLFLRHCC